jgi:hypothetical protein
MSIYPEFVEVVVVIVGAEFEDKPLILAIKSSMLF